MRDYNKSKIYKLVTNHTTDVYYGSTINPLYLRLSGHKGAYNRWINGMGKYMSSFEIIKYSDAKIILVEEFPCENKHQLERMEREYIELNDCVNKNIPTRESTCEHNRERYKCKECGGKGICEHNRERSYCKECGGIGICKHNRQRSQCKECMGSAICKHNKQRSTCKECGGSACSVCS